jgi:hypothetical protein
MVISDYHKKFTIKSDEEILQRIHAKEQELIQIFASISSLNNRDVIRLAVLGCADKRLVQWHKKVFERVLNKKVELTTFDIAIEHLWGEENVVQHDCTLSLPKTPYDITYAHVLLKFIPQEKQFDVIKNSFFALNSWGVAIHILDTSDYETIGTKQTDWCFTIPLADYKQKLTQLNISYKEIPNKYGVALVLLKD